MVCKQQKRPTANKTAALTAMAQALLLLVSSPTLTASAAEAQEQNKAEAGGSIRLQPNARVSSETAAEDPMTRAPLAPAVVPMSEFERYVQRLAGKDREAARREAESANDPGRVAAELEPIRRFGSELMSDASRGGLLQESSTQIPQDYVINVGDEILVTLWGSVDADLRLTVDRSGRITIPRVGPVMLAGVRYADLNSAIDQRVSQVFRNYKISTSLGRLRSIRIYVTGFTQRPGAYTVSSLSTLVTGLMKAGGPTGAGSFRHIELRRAGKVISSFDFYELLIKGDKTADRTLQADDVIHIGAVGPQVALIGSVNKPAIFELKPQDTLADVLAMAGGFSAVADRSRFTLERLDARNDARVIEVPLPQQEKNKPRDGDILRAFSAVETALPQHKQSKRIKVEGEVHRPGEFILPANSTLADAIKAAGGLTPGAYLYGTDFSRESVRIKQSENYERALRAMEIDLLRASSGKKALSADEAATQVAKEQSSTRLVERLRSLKPTGRVVLEIQPEASSLPDLSLEDGDRLHVPAVPKSIGVFGSVFNSGSYLYKTGAALGEFMKLAGGPTKGADTGSSFVVRANGSVVSARQSTSGWFMSGNSLENLTAQPGDTVFVPEEMNKSTFMQEAKEWTQILYQFGLGAAALKTLKN